MGGIYQTPGVARSVIFPILRFDTLGQARHNPGMQEREYCRLKRQIQDDYTKKLEALDLVWSLSTGGQEPPALSPKDIQRAANGDGQSTISQALAYMPEEFTTKDVCDWLATNASNVDRTTVSHSLKRMKGLELIEIGRGKRSSRYRKTGAVEARITNGNHGALSSEAQHFEIKRLARLSGYEALKFRNEVLFVQYGVNRLGDLTSEQASEVIANLTEELRQQHQSRSG